MPESTTPPPPPSGPPATAQRTPLAPRDLVAEARSGLVPALVGLGSAFAAAILVTLVAVAGLALVGDAGATGTTDGVDTGSAATLLLLPFQALGLGLLGTAHLSAAEVEGSAYAPIYWITAAFVVGAVITARRAERRDGPTSPGTQVRSGALAGLALAVVLLVALRLLALRSDGVTLHTASVSLFLGVLVLTTGSVWAGRWSVSGRWHPAIDLDLVVAARLLWSVLVAWLVLVVPVVLVLVLVAEGVGALLVGLALAPTAAVALVELSHLGAYSAAGDLTFAWSSGALAGVLLPLAGLVSLVATSVAWHLRRVRPAAGDAWSWLALPTVSLVAGLVLLLAGLVVLGGGFAGFGATITVAPAFWTVPLLGVWGLATEALSRTLAPSLAPAVPDALRRRLEHRAPLHVGADPTAAAAADVAPRTPEQRRRDRRVALVGGGALGVLVLLGVGYGLVASAFFGPDGRAEAYLDAVVDGDLDRAADLAPFDYSDDDALYASFKYADDTTRADLFDSAVYQAAPERITGYEVLDSTTRGGDTAVLEVRLEGIEGEPTAELVLVKDGRRLGIFPDWSISQAGLAQAVFSPIDQGSALSVNGVAVEAEAGADQWLLPGAYEIDPYADNPFLQSQGEPLQVTTDGSPTLAMPEQPQVTDEFRAQLQAEVDDYLGRCMASSELDPEGCPQSTYAFGDGVRTVRWQLTRAPEADLEYVGTEFPTSVFFSDGEAEVTYEADQSYGFGAPDFQRETETTPLGFSAEVDVEGDQLTVTFED